MSIVRIGKNNKLLLVTYKNIFLGLWKVKSEEVYRGLKINFSLFAQLGQMLIPIGKEKERKVGKSDSILI